ncbi:MAG: hypothetical protein RBT49_11180 [Bacteroidales bacterium]|nr:hypothetical protein [Bacteroidales bacterium]
MSDYYYYFTIADNGNILIIRHLKFRDCLDKSDEGYVVTTDYCAFHNSDISVSSITTNDNSIVLKGRNNQEIFKWGGLITNDFKLCEFSDSYDTQRCLKAVKHLFTLLQSDAAYSRNNKNDPFASDNTITNKTEKNASYPTKPNSISNTPSATSSFKSIKYGYSIIIPTGFVQASATGRNIDLKLINIDGTSILVNVTPRTPDELNITAHDYSKEMLEREFKQYTPNTSISKAEKIYISGEKAFLINYNNTANNTKAIEIYMYKGSYAYVFTGTCGANLFQTYEPIFLKAFYSFKF